MTRLTMALVACLCLVQAAPASLSPQRDRLPPHQPALEAAPAKKKEGEIVIDARTEIKVDGRECRYTDIPKGAEIILIDLGPDKTVRKIHSRTKK